MDSFTGVNDQEKRNVSLVVQMLDVLGTPQEQRVQYVEMMDNNPLVAELFLYAYNCGFGDGMGRPKEAV